MTRVEKTVFISYRRTNIYTARAIYQNLTSNGYDVFFDYENINSGDFEQMILQSIESRAHFLLILTPSALERAQNPDDWLRREIEHALTHKRNIIPITFEGFKFEEMQQHLPPHIAEPLRRYNALRVPSDYFDEAMKRLRTRYLDVPLDVVLHPKSHRTTVREQRQQQAQQAAPQVTEDALNAEEYFERGYRAVEKGQLDDGIQHYSRAIQLQPDYAEAYNNRGTAYDSKGDYEAALDDYNQAIALKSDHAVAYANRGNTYGRTGQHDKAIADLTRAIELQPDSATAYEKRGWIYDAAGNLEAALADYDRAIARNPHNAMTYNNRAVAHYRNGNKEAARNDWQRALDVDPDYTLAEKNLHTLQQQLTDSP